MNKLASGVREFQFLISANDAFYLVCRVWFSTTDASIYLMPYAAAGSYYYGEQAFPKATASFTFPFAEEKTTKKAPKVSIHESGQVHVELGRERVGPLFIPALKKLTGEHVASISVDRFDRLPQVTANERPSPQKAKVVFASEGHVSGRFAIYINGTEPKFRSSHIAAVVRLSRFSLGGPLYIGIAPVAQSPVADPNGRQGVTVICGWSPATQVVENFLFLRGQ